MVKIVKIALFVSLVASFAFSLTSYELARNVVANSAQDAKLRLLFGDKDYVDEAGNADWSEIVRVLKTNALVNFTLPSSRSLQLHFVGKSEAVVFVKLINEALNQAGFVYFTPIKFDAKSDTKRYVIQVDSRYILDPASFYAILKQNFVVIKNVRRLNAYDYEYQLDFANARLKTNAYAAINYTAKLPRPMKDYVFSVQGAKTLNARASSVDNWFPKLFFLDKNLNLLKSIMSDKKQTRVSISVPSAAVYVIIGDAYNLDNIRRGLEVELTR